MNNIPHLLRKALGWLGTSPDILSERRPCGNNGLGMNVKKREMQTLLGQGLWQIIEFPGSVRGKWTGRVHLQDVEIRSCFLG
jgi:hypothetical protein